MIAIAVSVDELLGVSASVGFSPIAPPLFWRIAPLTRVYSGISVNNCIKLHFCKATTQMWYAYQAVVRVAWVPCSAKM